MQRFFSSEMFLKSFFSAGDNFPGRPGTSWSLSKWRMSTRGAMDGRPWAHWKGSWQQDSDATRLTHSSLLRVSLNLMAPVFRISAKSCDALNCFYEQRQKGMDCRMERFDITMARQGGQHLQHSEWQSPLDSSCWTKQLKQEERWDETSFNN